MPMELFNTMGRSLQEFIPIHAGKAGFYGCGPTVYNYAHIGNLRAYVFQDTLSRTLSFLGYDVHHVMNITDIGHLANDADEGEDKMVASAKERGMSVLEIASYYTEAFFNDTQRLNIRMPTTVCKATEHIPEMIELISRIEANGHTYQSGGNLYFDISTFPEYGKLANLNLDDLKAGARIDVDPNKRNPYDFVLWFTNSKFENQALVWDSPWGRGYPGWHIECSAMSIKYLGESFDIHSGGIDHIPIHHTNEIAQSEAATGKKWVSYWLHNEFLVMDKGKMSKSSGNFLTLQHLIDQGYEPLDYRLFLLGGHYRSQLAFSWESMEGAKNARKNMIQRVAKIIEATKALPDAVTSDSPHTVPLATDYLDRFRVALEADLSTPRAIAELQGLIRDSSLSPRTILATIEKMDEVLALSIISTAQTMLDKKQQMVQGPGADARIDALISERSCAKKDKNYARADEIRNQLSAEGIILEDGPSGTIWKRIDLEDTTGCNSPGDSIV